MSDDLAISFKMHNMGSARGGCLKKFEGGSRLKL